MNTMISTRSCQTSRQMHLPAHQMQRSRDRPPGLQAAVCAATPGLLSTLPLEVGLDAGSSTSAAMRFHISTGHELNSYSAQVCRRFVVWRSLKLFLLQDSRLCLESLLFSMLRSALAVSCGPSLFSACDQLAPANTQDLKDALAAALPAAAAARGVRGSVSVAVVRSAPELYPFHEARSYPALFTKKNSVDLACKRL